MLIPRGVMERYYRIRRAEKLGSYHRDRQRGCRCHGYMTVDITSQTQYIIIKPVKNSSSRLPLASTNSIHSPFVAHNPPPPTQ